MDIKLLNVRAALAEAAENNHQRQHDNSDLWRFHKEKNWRECTDYECVRYRNALDYNADETT